MQSSGDSLPSGLEEEIRMPIKQPPEPCQCYQEWRCWMGWVIRFLLTGDENPILSMGELARCKRGMSWKESAVITESKNCLDIDSEKHILSQ